MALPAHGRSRDEVLGQLADWRAADVRWREGRAFTLAYDAGPDVHDLAEHVVGQWMTDNALNTDAFPSLRRIQADVVDIVLGWLGAPDDAAGFMTTGGTESLLMAVRAAREWGRHERGITRPNVVLPASAHAALEKGCDYFGVESRRIPVAADWRADPAAMAAAIDDSTVMLVASAPQYPQGVIDPVAAVAAVAEDHGVLCHVDACMGGVTLPYLTQLGYPVPAWNFAVPGVTSMSVDLHKFGYTAKGASVIAYRSKGLRRHQTFVTDNWLGGTYGSSGVLGTKSGAPMAAAWAVMQYLGDDGYRRLAATAKSACDRLAGAIAERPGLVLRAAPDAMLFAFGAADPDRLDVFALADALWRRGWYVDRQGPPASLHCTVNAVHDGHIDEFLDDFDLALAEVSANAARGAAGAYGTVD